jgi:hypothetical protein
MLYLWEAGRAWPPTTQALRLARHVGVDIGQAVRVFYGREPAWLGSVTRFDAPAVRELVTLILCDLKADVSTVRLARATGFSRFGS